MAALIHRRNRLKSQTNSSTKSPTNSSNDIGPQFLDSFGTVDSDGKLSVTRTDSMPHIDTKNPFIGHSHNHIDF